MKKWFILFVLLILGILLLTGCTVNLNLEREVSGKIVAVSGPFTFNGVNVVMIIWEVRKVSASESFTNTENDKWFVTPPDIITSANSPEGKTMTLQYKIINKNIPLVQGLSFQEIQ